MANMGAILGDPQRIEALAADFVEHYEKRISEGSTVAGKALFVSSSRPIAYAFYKQVIKLRPEWAEVRVAAEGVELSKKQKKEILPMERIKMVMTRGKDDEKALYDLLGNKDDRKKFEVTRNRQATHSPHPSPAPGAAGPPTANASPSLLRPTQPRTIKRPLPLELREYPESRLRTSVCLSVAG